jgi:nucleoside-triphosphatase THEP1
LTDFKAAVAPGREKCRGLPREAVRWSNVMTIKGAMRLAAMVYHSGFKIDDFLTRLADLLRADQVKLAGVLQENTRDVSGACSAMTLVDLTSRSRFRISQDLGSQAEGCRLDVRGIAEIGPLLERTIDQDAELIILNRFGKAEAEGGGLRAAFVRAMEAGIPTLTAVREPYIEAWSQFHGRLAIDLPADFATVLAWCRESVRQLRAARRSEMSPTG